MAEAHGARIYAGNCPGGGVAFRFTLPVTHKPPEVGTPSDDDA